MQIRIGAVNGCCTHFYCEVEPDDLLGTLKEKIFERNGIPPEEIDYFSRRAPKTVRHWPYPLSETESFHTQGIERDHELFYILKTSLPIKYVTKERLHMADGFNMTPLTALRTIARADLGAIIDGHTPRHWNDDNIKTFSNENNLVTLSDIGILLHIPSERVEAVEMQVKVDHTVSEYRRLMAMLEVPRRNSVATLVSSNKEGMPPVTITSHRLIQNDHQCYIQLTLTTAPVKPVTSDTSEVEPQDNESIIVDIDYLSNNYLFSVYVVGNNMKLGLYFLYRLCSIQKKIRDMYWDESYYSEIYSRLDSIIKECFDY